MLTPQQIESLSLTTEQLMQPVTEFLIDDIARRVSEAGQFTSSAAYQIWRAQALGVDRKTIEKELQKKLNVSNAEVKKLLKQSAEVGYNFDMKGFGEKAIPFSENKSLQQIIEAAMKMSNDTFKNLTQTIGFVDPYGNAKGLTEAYQSSCDFAFNQVVTGATDYNTAIRNATKNLADKGIVSIDYASGVHTSLEAAVRRNIMGGLGLMQEQISQQNHDAFGADGWEISAHSASAPDHEDIQGKQYTDEEFEALNNSLKRRIGTLNCGHAAFPIILGVSEPQYTEKQLKQFKEENKKGVNYNGKHYTTYEATQKQRQIERAIRRQKRRVMVAKGSNDKDAQLISKAKLRRLNEEYKRYSDAVGLPLQRERAYIGKIGKVVETKPIVEKKKPSFVPAKTIDEANASGSRMVAQAYERHRIDNNLRVVPYDELPDPDNLISANYGKMSVESASVFNDTISELVDEYDTPLCKIRTMTKEEYMFQKDSFAFVSHNYSVDSAEMVINPVKCKNIDELSDRIKVLSDKGYCVKISDDVAEKYIATHEFSHTILNVQEPLKNSTNFVNADYVKIKKARKEIDDVYKEYMSEVKTVTKICDEAEFAAIIDPTEETWATASEARKALNAVKISDYSLTDVDEFMAESFANEKLGTTSNKYSKRVVDIIDKYFKR